MKVSRSRWSKSMRIAVVDTGVGLNILNVAANSRSYATNLGLSNKEIHVKVVKSNRGTALFGEAMSDELQAHSFT